MKLGLAKAPERPLEGVQVKVERSARSAPVVAFATPDAPRLRRLVSERQDRHDSVRLPGFSTWALVWIRNALEDA